jgi:hypothetical protein
MYLEKPKCLIFLNRGSNLTFFLSLENVTPTSPKTYTKWPIDTLRTSSIIQGYMMMIVESKYQLCNTWYSKTWDFGRMKWFIATPSVVYICRVSFSLSQTFLYFTIIFKKNCIG